MKVALFSLLLLGVVVGATAQKQIPKKVLKAFNDQYTETSNVKWSVDDDGYYVSFEHDSYVKTAIYSEDANWISTTTQIPTDDLDECITDFIEEEYFDPEIIEAEFIETPDSEDYYVTIAETEETEIEIEEEPEEEVEEESLNYIRLKFTYDCEFVGEE